VVIHWLGLPLHAVVSFVNLNLSITLVWAVVSFVNLNFYTITLKCGSPISSLLSYIMASVLANDSDDPALEAGPRSISSSHRNC
jgi:hypothetical protein